MGKMQSPIDVPKNLSTRKSKIRFTYKAGSATVVNNGHTVQVNVSNGNFLAVGNEWFELLQFHFDTPSENKVQGK